MFTIAEILDIAVQIEENGEAYYRKAIATVANPELAEMFRWLADQEAAHAAWFAEMRTRVDDTAENPDVAGVGRALLREAVAEKRFSLDDTRTADIDRVRTLIELSITFEQDTAMFYELLRPFVTDETDRSLLDEILSQENLHVEKLRSFLDSEAAKTE